jgi:hypothetical protein
MTKQNKALQATLCLLSLLAGCVNTFAQEPSAGQSKARTSAPVPAKKIPSPPKSSAPEGWPDVAVKLLQPQFAFGSVVKGAPYSATAVTETTQTLGDGNQIIQKTEVAAYRDGEGRTRQEQTLRGVGRWVSDGEPLRIIFINDPVAGVSYTLDPRARSASRRNYFRAKGPVKDGAPASDGNSEARKKIEALGSRMSDGPIKDGAPTMAGSSNAIRKVEALGKRMIEGMEAEGIRATTITPAGVIGNRLPIEVTDERWYSPGLQILIMRERRDPRSGDTVYRLMNISRHEPARSLFEVPPDYTLKDETKPVAHPVKKPKAAQQ